MLLRPARPGDEAAVAQVHVRAWQQAYRGLLPDEYLDRLDPSERASRYTFGGDDPGGPHTTVAVDDDSICGFAATGPCRDPDRPGAGELYAIYVDPNHWGRGLGRALIDAARRGFVDQHLEDAVLWMLVGNQRADRFYRIDGWRPDGQRRMQEIHGIDVDEVRYHRTLG